MKSFQDMVRPGNYKVKIDIIYFQGHLKGKGSLSVVSNSLRPHGLQPTRLLHPWNFPGKNIGVGCHIGVSKAQGITYYLHCTQRPQSSRKVERANQVLKSAIKKIIQETSLGRKEALRIALLRTCIAPKEQAGLSPYEMLCGRPFVYVNDLFLDPEAQTLQAYIMAIGQFQQDICLWSVNQDPKDSNESPLYASGTQVLIKV